MKTMPNEANASGEELKLPVKLQAKEIDKTLKPCKSKICGKPYKCDLCSMSFNQKHNAIQHKRTYTAKKLHKCNFCQKSYSKKGNLNIHLRMHDGKPYQCSLCSKCFFDKTTLTSHMSIHTADKVYKCNFCTSTFLQKAHFIYHMRAHTDEKLFKCKICFKSFSKRLSLDKHNKIHIDEKRFNCAICSKGFFDKTTLISHMSIHITDKTYNCKFCRITFLQKDHFIYHMRVHSGENPFNCEICFKSFPQKSLLNEHNKIHIDEKRFSCFVCECAFSQKSSLTAHMKIHIEVNPFKGNYDGKLISQSIDCNRDMSIVCKVEVNNKNNLFEFVDCGVSKDLGSINSESVSDDLNPMSMCEGNMERNPASFAVTSAKTEFSDSVRKNEEILSEDDDKVHIDEKRFSCFICKCAFSQKSSLTAHMKIHIELNPLKGKYCGKRFSQSINCIHHMSTVCKHKVNNKNNLFEFVDCGVSKDLCSIKSESVSDDLNPMSMCEGNTERNPASFAITSAKTEFSDGVIKKEEILSKDDVA